MSRLSGYGYIKGNYNSSSSAYALQPEFVPNYEDGRQQKRQEQVSRVQEKKRNIQITLHRVKLFVTLSVVFVGVFAAIGVGAMVTEQVYINKSLNEELIRLKNDNVALQAEIADKIDLEYIKNEAINRLGMAEPQAYQLAYISVPKQSYTVQYESSEVKEESSFSIASIVGLFKK